MSQKILVADDSLTVQKVVSITLASYDYELVECKDESQLKEQLMIGGASLLLLDLNLSENKSGYTLAKEVKAKNPKLPIILLLGTFDSVDEAAFDSAGISDRIVKPFESNVFTQKVQSIMESSEAVDMNDENEIFTGETESNFLNDLEDITPSSLSDNESADNWVVDSPSPIDTSSETWDSFAQEDEERDRNSLEASLEGWGMNVPGPIGATVSDMDMELPGVIEERVSQHMVSNSATDFDIVHDEEKHYPDSLELSYPDAGEDQEIKVKQTSFNLEDEGPSSAFVSTDEFNLDVSDDEEDLEKTDPQFKLPTNSLVTEIEEDESSDDFWAVDTEEVDPSVNIVEEVEAEEEEEEAYHAEPDEESSIEISQDSFSLEPLGDPRGNEPFELKIETNSKASTSDIDKEALTAKLLEELKPMLHAMIETYCKETIESVAWQIIPDLAENLIRNEIKEIKEKNSNL